MYRSSCRPIAETCVTDAPESPCAAPRCATTCGSRPPYAWQAARGAGREKGGASKRDMALRGRRRAEGLRPPYAWQAARGAGREKGGASKGDMALRGRRRAEGLRPPYAWQAARGTGREKGEEEGKERNNLREERGKGYDEGQGRGSIEGDSVGESLLKKTRGRNVGGAGEGREGEALRKDGGAGTSRGGATRTGRRKR
eukprot:350697-Chlamydomonas_euryale.AAC.6